jgi:hypothetical protein
MKTKCEKCGLEYDDMYRLTYCPHDKFPISQSAKKLLEEQGIPTEEPEK